MSGDLGRTPEEPDAVGGEARRPKEGEPNVGSEGQGPMAKQPPPPDDPFDVARLRAVPLAEVGVKKVLLTVPVRRPGRNEFFRVHPASDYALDCHVLEHSEEMSSDTYWVSSAVQADVVEHLRAVRLFTCVNKQGTPFLWPAKGQAA